MGTALPLPNLQGAKSIHRTGFVLNQGLPLGQSGVAEKEWQSDLGLGHRLGRDLNKKPRKTDRNGAPHSGAAF